MHSTYNSAAGLHRTTIGLLTLVFIGTVLLNGQGNTGTILGVVHDPSSSVLPGADISVVNVETGIARNSLTGNRGEYRVPALPPGTYEVQASMAGFQVGIRKGITLNVGQDATVNFTLQVGDVAESVTITGEAPMVETTSATVSGVVDPNQMREIPLNARSFLELVPLQAGAIFAENADSSATKGFGRKLSIGGTRYTANSFLLDGSNMNDAAGAAGSAGGTLAGVETIREFRVITNAYDAEYGRHTGGVISAVTKSGTNSLHGSVFEFLRNDNLDANKWEDNARGDGEKPEFRRNQFGFAVGGPIVKDRSFFFGSYEGLREDLGQTQSFNVPSLAVRNGFLGGRPVQIDPKVKPFLDSYPLPTSPASGDIGVYSASLGQPTNQNFWAGKLDHRFSDADSVFGRFVWDDSDRDFPGANSFNTIEQGSTASRFATAEYMHIYSPVLLSRTMVSYNRTDIAIKDIEAPGFTFPLTTFSSFTDGFGNIAVSGLASWGGGSTNPKRNVQNNYQVKQDYTYSPGSHALKFGFHFDRFQVNQRSEARGFGTFSFGSLANFLANDVAQATFIRPGSDTIRGYRESLFALYLQDDLRLSDRLTLNLGLRYEFTNTPTEVNGKVANIRNTTEAFLYRATLNDVSTGDPWYLNPSLKNFAPKAGIAWDIFGNGRTSLRAGAGLWHDLFLPSNLLTWGVRVPPYFVNIFLESCATCPRINFPDTFFSQPELVQGGGGLARAEGFQFKADQAKVFKWSLDIEHGLMRDLSIQLGYSGTRGLHLQRGPLRLIANLAIENARHPDGGTRRFIMTGAGSYPSRYWSFFRWAYTDGTSDYHALRAVVNKRFSHRVQFQTSYTFSKTTDDGSNWSGSNDFQSTIRGYRDVKLHALSAFDFRHNFSANFVYDLPGQNLAGPAAAILGGWNIGGLLRLNSGSPLNIDMQQPRPRGVSALNVDGPSVDLVPNGNNNPVLDGGRNPEKYFDTSQFRPTVVCQQPIAGTQCNGFLPPNGTEHGFFQGNLGSNTLISPGVANLDVTFTKNTRVAWLGETGSLQFRTEFYNILNRPNFSNPATTIFNRATSTAPDGIRPTSDAARIDNTRLTSRELQFGVKLIF